MNERSDPEEKAASSSGRNDRTPGSVPHTEDPHIVLGHKLKLLRQGILEIEDAVETRTKLTSKFRSQIEKEIQEAVNYLSSLPPAWKAGFLPEMEFLRLSLHKSLTSRKKDRRTQELSEWGDLASLMKERRRLVMEYEVLKKVTERLKNGDRHESRRGV